MSRLYHNSHEPNTCSDIILFINALVEKHIRGIIYITDRKLFPLQVVLRNMIDATNVSQELAIANSLEVAQLPPETIKMATIVIAIVPILVVYPFLQKYFVKGMVIGSIKG